MAKAKYTYAVRLTVEKGVIRALSNKLTNFTESQRVGSSFHQGCERVAGRRAINPLKFT